MKVSFEVDTKKYKAAVVGDIGNSPNMLDSMMELNVCTVCYSVERSPEGSPDG